MDEITCDFAEIYHVLDADALPPRLFATLALGLPDESRFKRALSGSRAGGRDLLLAAAVDRLSTLVWFQTKDGVKGRNRPKSIVESMMRKEEEKEQPYCSDGNHYPVVPEIPLQLPDLVEMGRVVGVIPQVYRLPDGGLSVNEDALSAERFSLGGKRHD